MQTFNLTPTTGGVTVVENGGQAYTRPLGYDTLANRGDSVMIEQRPASGGVWGRRIYTTDSLTVAGVPFSGTAAQMMALLQTTFANNTSSSGGSTSSDFTTTEVTTLKGIAANPAKDGRILAVDYCNADGTTDDAQGLANALTAIGQRWNAATDEQSADYSAEVYNAVIDLCGRDYLINSPVPLPLVSGRTLGNFQMKNGRIRIGDALKASGSYMFDWTKAEKIKISDLTFIGKAGDGLNRNVFRFTSSVGVLFENVRGIDLGMIVKGGANSFDIVVNNCSCRNFTAPYSPAFFDVEGDCIFTNNYMIGCDTAIITRLGNNLVRGNHFYNIQSGFALTSLVSSAGMIFSDNYMDGCSVKAEGMGYGVQIRGNSFQNMKQYAAVVLAQYNNNPWTSNLIVTNNVIKFSLALTPTPSVAFSYNSGTGIITVTSGVSLTSFHEGAILQNNATDRLQIWEVTSPTTAKVRQAGTGFFAPGTYTLTLNPSNVLFKSNVDHPTYKDTLENILVNNNTLAMDSESGQSAIKPITLN